MRWQTPLKFLCVRLLFGLGTFCNKDPPRGVGEGMCSVTCCHLIAPDREALDRRNFSQVLSGQFMQVVCLSQSAADRGPTSIAPGGLSIGQCGAPNVVSSISNEKLSRQVNVSPCPDLAPQQLDTHPMWDWPLQAKTWRPLATVSASKPIQAHL